MPIADILNVTLTVSAAGPTVPGFGEPLIAAYHTHFTDRVREYSSLAGMAADGFLSTDPAYLVATNVFAQRPSVPFLKIGRRALPVTQIVLLTCLSAVNTDVYKFTLQLPGGTPHVVTVNSTGTPATDVATINTAVTALALANLTATHGGAILTLTMGAGFLLDVQTDVAHMTLQNTSADPGLNTDLTAINAFDSKWYGLLLDSQSALEIAAAALWVEGGATKQFAWNNSDTICATAATTDIFSTEQALSHERSGGIFAQTQMLSYSAAAWMGRLYPTLAGSENWAMKTLINVPVDTLTDSQAHAVEGKNGTIYTSLFGVPLTQFGKTPGGEWMDIIRGNDSLTTDLQVGAVSLQSNSLKVPFTDAGADRYRSMIGGVLLNYVQRGFLSSTPAPFVFIPLISTVSSVNKALRNFPGMTFAATYAGAINSATLTGTLTF
jgi:hypothetical protein